MGNLACDCNTNRKGFNNIVGKQTQCQEEFPNSVGKLVEEEEMTMSKLSKPTLAFESYSRILSREFANSHQSAVVWTEAVRCPEYGVGVASAAIHDVLDIPQKADPKARFQTAVLSVKWAAFNQFDGGPSPEEAGIQEEKPSSNTNKPQDYVWITSPLQAIIRNEGSSLGCKHVDTGKDFTPIFIVAGGCPNPLCGMQAVLYCVDSEGKVDFWWVKPHKNNPNDLESATLSRHNKGPNKNDPGRSYQFYKPLADMFTDGTVREGWQFGIEKVTSRSGDEASRAFIQGSDKNRNVRFYVHLLWQEDWTNNPFSSKKYIKGKIVYQKLVNAAQFFCRQYEIHDGMIYISDYEEPPFSTVIPAEDLKKIYAMGKT